MSKISVTTIAGLTSGGDANVVKIESGDTFQALSDATVGGNLGVNGITTSTGTIVASSGVAIGGTGAANTLDDYEEGTFTPAYTSGITGTYQTQLGTYTKIGRLVYVEIHIDGNSMSGDSNQVKIGGLPFATQNASASNGGAYHVYTGGTYNGGNDVTWLFARNEAVVYAYNISGATFRGNQWSDVNGGYRIAGFYQAA